MVVQPFGDGHGARDARREHAAFETEADGGARDGGLRGVVRGVLVCRGALGWEGGHPG